MVRILRDERYGCGDCHASLRPSAAVRLLGLYREDASLAAQGRHSPGHQEVRQRRLPGLYSFPHRLPSHHYRGSLHLCRAEQLHFHLGAHTSRRDRSHLPGAHVPIDARVQHRHDSDRYHRRSPELGPGPGQRTPSRAVSFLLQHLWYHHLVSASVHARRPDHHGAHSGKHHRQVPLVRPLLPSSNVLRLSRTRLCSLHRWRRLSLRHRRHHSHYVPGHRLHQRHAEEAAQISPAGDEELGMVTVVDALPEAARPRVRMSRVL